MGSIPDLSKPAVSFFKLMPSSPMSAGVSEHRLPSAPARCSEKGFGPARPIQPPSS